MAPTPEFHATSGISTSVLKYGLDVNIKTTIYGEASTRPSKIEDILHKHIEEIKDEIISYLFETDKGTIEFRKKTVDDLKSLFSMYSIYVKEIPNEYSKYGAPWLLVTTPKGVIKIGWRSRVIEIDWSLSDVNLRSYDLFPKEDVTKDNYRIHAWGLDKAKEYIGVILNASQVVDRE